MCLDHPLATKSFSLFQTLKKAGIVLMNPIGEASVLIVGASLCSIASPHKRNHLSFNFCDRHTTTVHFLSDVDAIAFTGAFE